MGSMTEMGTQMAEAFQQAMAKVKPKSSTGKGSGPVQLTLKQIEYLKQGVRSLRENRPVKASMHATVENPAGEVLRDG